MSTRLIVMAGVLAGFAAFTPMSKAQYWTATPSPITNWGPIACSADGSKVVSAIGASRSYPLATGAIYISSNRGGTWAPTSAPAKTWSGLASSADARTLLACPNAGVPYFSTDGGSTWTAAQLPVTNWLSVACSADGTRLLAASSGGHVFQSTNSGASWAVATGLPSGNCMALSANGRLAVVADNPSSIYTFTNVGALAWYLRGIGPDTNWVSVAASADGRKLTAAASPLRPLFPPSPGRIFLSSDYGMTWQPTGSSSQGWRAVTSSADGTQLAAISLRGSFPVIGGTIFISTNSGATWTNTLGSSFDWQQIASSADGSLKWASSAGGPICYWQATPAPVLNIAVSADTVTLSWIIPAGQFVLQQNLDLKPGNWTDVSVMPGLDYDTLVYWVSLPLGPGTSFYRLIGR